MECVKTARSSHLFAALNAVSRVCGRLSVYATLLLWLTLHFISLSPLAATAATATTTPRGQRFWTGNSDSLFTHPFACLVYLDRDLVPDDTFLNYVRHYSPLPESGGVGSTPFWPNLRIDCNEEPGAGCTPAPGFDMQPRCGLAAAQHLDPYEHCRPCPKLSEKGFLSVCQWARRTHFVAVRTHHAEINATDGVAAHTRKSRSSITSSRDNSSQHCDERNVEETLDEDFCRYGKLEDRFRAIDAPPSEPIPATVLAPRGILPGAHGVEHLYVFYVGVHPHFVSTVSTATLVAASSSLTLSHVNETMIPVPKTLPLNRAFSLGGRGGSSNPRGERTTSHVSPHRERSVSSPREKTSDVDHLSFVYQSLVAPSARALQEYLGENTWARNNPTHVRQSTCEGRTNAKSGTTPRQFPSIPRAANVSTPHAVRAWLRQHLDAEALAYWAAPALDGEESLHQDTCLPPLANLSDTFLQQSLQTFPCLFIDPAPLDFGYANGLLAWGMAGASTSILVVEWIGLATTRAYVQGVSFAIQKVCPSCNVTYIFLHPFVQEEGAQGPGAFSSVGGGGEEDAGVTHPRGTQEGRSVRWRTLRDTLMDVRNVTGGMGTYTLVIPSLAFDVMADRVNMKKEAEEASSNRDWQLEAILIHNTAMRLRPHPYTGVSHDDFTDRYTRPYTSFVDVIHAFAREDIEQGSHSSHLVAGDLGEAPSRDANEDPAGCAGVVPEHDLHESSSVVLGNQFYNYLTEGTLHAGICLIPNHPAQLDIIATAVEELARDLVVFPFDWNTGLTILCSVGKTTLFPLGQTWKSPYPTAVALSPWSTLLVSFAFQSVGLFNPYRHSLPETAPVFVEPLSMRENGGGASATWRETAREALTQPRSAFALVYDNANRHVYALGGSPRTPSAHQPSLMTEATVGPTTLAATRRSQEEVENASSATDEILRMVMPRDVEKPSIDPYTVSCRSGVAPCLGGWQLVGHLPLPLQGHWASFGDDGYLYVFGGVTTLGIGNPTLYRARPRNWAWESLSVCPYGSRTHFAGVFFRNTTGHAWLYFLGTQGSPQVEGRLMGYSLSEQSWHLYEDVALPDTARLCLAVSGHSLLLLSATTMYRYEPETMTLNAIRSNAVENTASFPCTSVEMEAAMVPSETAAFWRPSSRGAAVLRFPTPATGPINITINGPSDASASDCSHGGVTCNVDITTETCDALDGSVQSVVVFTRYATFLQRIKHVLLPVDINCSLALNSVKDGMGTSCKPCPYMHITDGSACVPCYAASPATNPYYLTLCHAHRRQRLVRILLPCIGCPALVITFGVVAWVVVKRQRRSNREPAYRRSANAPRGGPTYVAYLWIEGAPQLWREQPHNMAEVASQLVVLVRGIMGERGCYEILNCGDSGLFTASTKEQLLRACTELWLQVAQRRWPVGRLWMSAILHIDTFQCVEVSANTDAASAKGKHSLEVSSFSHTHRATTLSGGSVYQMQRCAMYVHGLVVTEAFLRKMVFGDDAYPGVAARRDSDGRTTSFVSPAAAATQAAGVPQATSSRVSCHADPQRSSVSPSLPSLRPATATTTTTKKVSPYVGSLASGSLFGGDTGVVMGVEAAEASPDSQALVPAMPSVHLSDAPLLPSPPPVTPLPTPLPRWQDRFTVTSVPLGVASDTTVGLGGTERARHLWPSEPGLKESFLVRLGRRLWYHTPAHNIHTESMQSRRAGEAVAAATGVGETTMRGNWPPQTPVLEPPLLVAVQEGDHVDVILTALPDVPLVAEHVQLPIPCVALDANMEIRPPPCEPSPTWYQRLAGGVRLPWALARTRPCSAESDMEKDAADDSLGADGQRRGRRHRHEKDNQTAGNESDEHHGASASSQSRTTLLDSSGRRHAHAPSPAPPPGTEHRTSLDRVCARCGRGIPRYTRHCKLKLLLEKKPEEGALAASHQSTGSSTAGTSVNDQTCPLYVLTLDAHATTMTAVLQESSHSAATRRLRMHGQLPEDIRPSHVSVSPQQLHGTGGLGGFGFNDASRSNDGNDSSSSSPFPHEESSSRSTDSSASHAEGRRAVNPLTPPTVHLPDSRADAAHHDGGTRPHRSSRKAEPVAMEPEQNGDYHRSAAHECDNMGDWGEAAAAASARVAAALMDSDILLHPMVTSGLLTPTALCHLVEVVERLYEALMKPLRPEERLHVAEGIRYRLRLFTETFPDSKQRAREVALRMLQVMDMLQVKDMMEQLAEAATPP